MWINKSSKLYLSALHSSPEWLRTAFGSAYSMLMAREKYGKYYDYWRNKIWEMEQWDEDAMRSWQSRQLHKFLRYAIDNATYYSQNNIYLEGAEAISLDCMGKLPIIAKTVVRDSWDAFQCSGRKKRYYVRTTGSTGAPLRVALDSAAYQREYAYRWRFMAIANARPKDKIAYFNGNNIVAPIEDQSPPYHIIDKYDNSIYFSVYHMSEASIGHYVEAFNRFAPKYVKGYPSAIYEFVRMSKSVGRELVSPEAVFTASETLLPHQRKEIESYMETDVYEWYGQAETTANMHQCKYRNFHVKEGYGLLEILSEENEPVGPGKMGRAVATGWGNHAMPLIRYDTGDIMRLASDQICPCGLSGRIVDYIDGRKEDVLITPSGRVIGRLNFIFNDIDYLHESQIVQIDRDTVLIKVVLDSEMTVLMSEDIINAANKYLANEFRIEIDPVEKISRGRGGKIKYVVNRTLDESADE